MLTSASLLVGIVLLALGGFLLIRALPRNGKIHPAAADNMAGQLYAVAVVFTVTGGATFILNAILG